MMRLARLAKLWLLSATIVLAASIPSLAEDSADNPGFTDQTIAGAWGFSASGTIVPPAFPAPTPAVAVGIMEFDGAGLCVISDTINIGGLSLSRVSDICDYAVDPEGTGRISTQFPGDPGPVPLSFVLVDDANGFHFVRTDLGVASGTAERQNRRDGDGDNN